VRAGSEWSAGRLSGIEGIARLMCVVRPQHCAPARAAVAAPEGAARVCGRVGSEALRYRGEWRLPTRGLRMRHAGQRKECW